MNSTVAGTFVDVYVCPTNGPKLNLGGRYGSGRSLVGVPSSNYMANAGVTIRPGSIWPGAVCDVANATEGAMYEYGVVRAGDFRDGLSNTILLGEIAGRPGRSGGEVLERG